MSMSGLSPPAPCTTGRSTGAALAAGLGSTGRSACSGRGGRRATHWRRVFVQVGEPGVGALDVMDTTAITANAILRCGSEDLSGQP